MDKKIVKLKKPEMPNYIVYITDEGDSFPMVVSEISEQQAQEFAELMKQTFMQHYHNLKNDTWHKFIYKPKLKLN